MRKQKILFLAANPVDTDRSRLEAEMREIQEGLTRSKQREEISFDCRLAVRVRDLRRSLLEVRPQIVHFSGHGAGIGGIVVENDEGECVLVGTDALANLFELHTGSVRCVVLNACYSSEQAMAISRHIPIVIGMSDSVADVSAMAFAVGFYDAVGAGEDYASSFRHGRNAIELDGLPGHELPVMLQMATPVPALRSKLISKDGAGSIQNKAGRQAHQGLLKELGAIAAEATRYVQCIGMHKAVPFDQIYQPTRLLFRSGLNISAAAAFGEQNRSAQAIAVSRAEEFRSLTVESFLELPEDTIVFAGPGWGKTTFVHHLFRRKLAEAMTETVLVTLRRETALRDLETLCRHWFTYNVDQARRVLLLVDGYDEISLADRKRVSEYLELFRASKCGRFILTCRDYYQVISLPASHVRIDAFDLKDQYRFVMAFLAAQGSNLDATKLVNDLRARQFTEFLSHPLLLALACIVSSGARIEQPRGALRLLKRALITLQHTWDLERGVSRQPLTPLDGEDRMLILKRIAAASRSPIMRSERVEGITRTALDKMQISKVSPELVLRETAQFYGILVPSGDSWEFVHRTIQDYLAAQHWVDSGGFSSRTTYDWDTRTAYAACLSGDATRVLEGALAVPEGLTCAIETLTNSPDFDNDRVEAAFRNFYSLRGRVTVFERTEAGISAAIEDDLFSYLSPRFLNHLIERFVKKRTGVTDALTGCCMAELRMRRLRLDFTTHEVLIGAIPNIRFQFRISDREFVTPEMVRPV